MIAVAAIFAALRAMPRSRPFRYSFSGAGDPCLRALVYDAQDADDGKPPAEGDSEVSWLLSSVCGTAVGDALEKAAKPLGGASQVAAEFDTGSVRVTGSLDLLWPDGVDDFKLVGEKKWERIQSRPDPKHVLQINGYAVAKDKPRWRLIYIRAVTIFDGSETPEVRVHEGVASVEKAQELCGVWESVETHRRLRTLPERVWGASPEKFPCGWCRHLERCGPVNNEGGEP